jgi:hypothetical protein
MGYVLRLPTAGAASLPTLGDIGYLSKQNLKGLYLIDGGTGLTDISGTGTSLTLAGGTVTPAYAAGVLQFRGVANGAQVLSTGVPIFGPNHTMLIAVKKTGSSGAASGNGQVYAGHVSAQIASSNAGPLSIADNVFAAQAVGAVGLQATRPAMALYGPTHTANIGVWTVYGVTRSATAVAISGNGQTPVSLNYPAADPGTTTSNNVCLSDMTRFIEGDVGFFAHYDRAFTAADFASAYKAIKRLMAAKGIAI